MSRLFLPAIMCCCVTSFANSAFAVVNSNNHVGKNIDDCTNCIIIHQVNEEINDFEPANARNMVETIGYKVLTDPEKQKDRYVMLGEKGGFYSDLHVTKDRRIYVERMVDRDDPHWGSKIRR